MTLQPPSLQTLLEPLFEINSSLVTLLDIQWRVLATSDLMEQSHPEVAEGLRQANGSIIQQPIHRLRNEQWMLTLAFRQGLQHHLREYGT